MGGHGRESPNIDEIDEEILRLILKRIEILSSMGYEDAKNLLTSRRVSIAKRLAQRYGLHDETLANMLSYIDGLTLGSVKPLTVGFLGPRGSFTEEAALKMFRDLGATFIAHASIQDVFRAVVNGEAHYGVVPLENSLEGSVGETLDLLAQLDVKICGETEIKIKHNLIARPGTKLEEVKVVLSHPMALAQCRNFIYSRLKSARIETRFSTAEAVKEAIETPGYAAIGSELAATIYGGEIIVKGIEDHRDNYTRFIAIGYKPIDKGASFKTSIIFTVKDVPGALYKALEPFAVRGINLSKIESRPIKERPWEYMFFTDIEGSLEDQKVIEALEELRDKTTSLKILGTYRKIN